MSSAKEIISSSGIQFGTSGARGLVADFTNEVCAAFTLAFLQAFPQGQRLAIGIDNRPSSPAIASACIAAAQQAGWQVHYYGVLPTPALALVAMEDGIPAIMVTGSHIPFDRNGLKFYRPDGEIDKGDEQNILNASVEVPEIAVAALPEVDERASVTYLARYLSVFPTNMLAGKRIGLYEHSSAGRDLYQRLLRDLGAEVVCLGRSDAFVPIDTEAVSANDIEQAKVWQQTHALDAIFSSDGDGDRPLVFDENGDFVRGDILCLLAAKALGIAALAVPVSCNNAIELCGAFKHVVRTRIGSPYVIEAFSSLLEAHPSVAGFEANGGFLLASHLHMNTAVLRALPTRDAVLPFLAIMTLAKTGGISSIVNALPAYFTCSDRLQQVERCVSDRIIQSVKLDPSSLLEALNKDTMSVVEVNEIDGLRMTLEDGTVVHLRPSGNAPELRCYTGANTAEAAQASLTSALSWLRATVGQA